MKKLQGLVLLTLCCCGFAFSQGTGQGSGVGSGKSPQPGEANRNATVGVRVLAKPRADYTDLARQNRAEGYVRLRVTFLASGEIGQISPVVALPYGLTEQAWAAARKIKFSPATRNGEPVTTTKIVEYVFINPYDENEIDLKENAVIVEQPEPERPTENDSTGRSGKVKLTITLAFNGSVLVQKILTDLPKEFEEKARESASKIKFKPAIHKNGKEVSQSKEIEYEFKPQKK